MRVLLFACLLLASVATHAQPGAVTLSVAADSATPGVSLSIIRTSASASREGMLYAGGDFTRAAQVGFVAFLIRHGRDSLLVDTGLGSAIDAQYAEDMPVAVRPFFYYEKPVRTARAQLAAARMAMPGAVLLTHAHWDHASGVTDFPAADIWVSAAERTYMADRSAFVGSAWPSQVGAKNIRWRELAFAPVARDGFAESLDWWGDGSVVVVPLYGHTPGSVGVLVRVASGKRYFLVGDVVWSAAALAQGSPKFFAARWLVDHDEARTAQTIEQIRALQRSDPELVVVPAHDGAVHARLGYFPATVP